MIVSVVFNENGKNYNFISEESLKINDMVITEPEKGLQLATLKKINVENKNDKKLKTILRKATSNDYNKYLKNLSEEKEILKEAKKIVEKEKLNISIIDAKYTLDKKKLFFNFFADNRVDFRNFVKKLAAKYHTRIELHQVGVRDKAKICGGIGVCGRQLCCSSSLKSISSVNINMIKNQNVALNPSKINGVCGRLMCCLAYENEDYNFYKKGLPKVGSKYVYNGEEGKVIYVDIFERTCKLEMADSKVVLVDLGK
jgi:cell fate regulator YaaT (PSP1 superfamily)